MQGRRMHSIMHPRHQCGHRHMQTHANTRHDHMAQKRSSFLARKNDKHAKENQRDSLYDFPESLLSAPTRMKGRQYEKLSQVFIFLFSFFESSHRKQRAVRRLENISKQNIEKQISPG